MNKRVAPTIILVLMIIFILSQAGAIIYVLTGEGLGVFLTPGYSSCSPGNNSRTVFSLY